jgi:hypothetical protein
MRRHERRGSRTRGSPRQMSVHTKAVVLVLAAGFMGLLVGVAVSAVQGCTRSRRCFRLLMD